jgi:hypothetical protein
LNLLEKVKLKSWSDSKVQIENDWKVEIKKLEYQEKRTWTSNKGVQREISKANGVAMFSGYMNTGEIYFGYSEKNSNAICLATLRHCWRHQTIDVQTRARIDGVEGPPNRALMAQKGIETDVPSRADGLEGWRHC